MQYFELLSYKNYLEHPAHPALPPEIQVARVILAPIKSSKCPYTLPDTDVFFQVELTLPDTGIVSQIPMYSS